MCKSSVLELESAGGLTALTKSHQRLEISRTCALPGDATLHPTSCLYHRSAARKKFHLGTLFVCLLLNPRLGEFGMCET